MLPGDGDILIDVCPLIDRRRTVALVVDDDPTSRLIAVRALQRHGCETIEAGDGSEALAALSVRWIPLAVVDLQMPGMGGMELLRAIRADYPLTRCIVLTSSSSVSDALAVLKLGAVGFQTKPLELKRFNALIGIAFDQLRSWTDQLNSMGQARNHR